MSRLLVCTLLFCCSLSCHAQALPHHHLQVLLDPGSHRLECVDEISVPADSPRTLNFLLNSQLLPRSSDSELAARDTMAPEGLSRYAVTLPEGRSTFTVTYGGAVFEPPRQDTREARVFETSSGIIAEQGTVLSGASGWYPILENAPGDGMITFSLEVTVPGNWEAVSQGRMTRRLSGDNGSRLINWEELHPQDEIHLIAAPFRVYGKVNGDVTELVYLRNSDDELAQQYLDATTRYLGMYRSLIGEYPYAKFALVENFWETGYGMPSFTLLGSQVIRLPFIIYTSYPHEILHNWWGNGVYVEYQTGNWSEGLTAYLADHLLQEQKGTAADYRRSTLQKYSDYAGAGRDFPLKEFVSRHSASSEAVGYGKSLMMFHMLRHRIGDDKFKLGLQRFYAQYKFRRAGYRDLERTFSDISGEDLAPFFKQWVERPGAPELGLLKAETRPNGSGYALNVSIEQIQDGAPFALDLPLAVTTQGSEIVQMFNLGMSKKSGNWTFQLAKKPLRVDLDPEFDVFRRLDPSEVPPAFSQVFGAERQTFVLPRGAPADLKQQYQEAAAKWQQQAGPGAYLVWDDEIRELPKTGAVWLFGWENHWRDALKEALRDLNVESSDSTMKLAGIVCSQQENALALVAALGNTPVGWLAVPRADLMPVLARKLPHYSKYSYAAFAGEQLQNLAKGMWPQANSSLNRAVDDGAVTTEAATRGKLPPRPSLIND